MKYPKVLVFTITYEGKDYIFPTFRKYSQALNYPNMKHIWIDNSKDLTYYRQLKRRGVKNVYHVQRGNNTRETLARSQNFARRKAIEGHYDYALSLESDVLCPPTLIQKLMVHGFDCVSGVYCIGNRNEGVRYPCIALPYKTEAGTWGTRLLNPEELKDYYMKGLKQVAAGSFGCCLFHKNIFEKVRFTYDPLYKGHSDIYFYNKLMALKIPVFVDTDIYCEHFNTPWSEVKDR